MSKNGCRGKMIDQVLKAITFMETHRQFTIQDLSDELGINKKNGAQWLVALSIRLPIREIKPLRYGNKCGLLPALYRLEKI